CTVVVNPTILITVDTTFQNSSNFNVTLRTLGSRRIFDVTGVGITFNLDGMAGGGTGGITLSDGNGAGGGGGGGAVRSLNATSTVNIEDIVFVSNFAITSSGGGSIRNAGIMNITNSSFTDSNTNGTGGDILNSGTMTVTGSTFFSANATGFGGSIFTTGNLTVTGSTFNANQSGSGGGAIRIAGGDVNIVNSIFIDNTAPGSGQALSIDLATPAVDVSGTTFTNNNCVIITGSFNDLGGNIRDAASAGCAGIIPVALSASAVCNGANLDVTITAGDVSFNITGTGPNLPQNGVGLGTTAVTGPGSWTGVTVTETGGDAESLNLGNFTCLPVYTVSTCDFASLQTAVTNANATGGTINFTCSGTINFTSDLTITNNVTINENGQNVVLDGNFSTHHFMVDVTGILTLNDLTLRGGDSGGAGSIANGGVLNLNNNIFEFNFGSAAGAIFNLGDITSVGNTFFGNLTFSEGGAIHNNPFGIINSTNDIFNANTADNDGGAVFNEGSITFTNPTFINNDSFVANGAISNLNVMTIIGGSFTDNTSSSGASAIGNTGTLSSQNVTYTNNTCTGTITDNGGNVRNSASVGCPGTLVIDLLVLPLACAGNNMAVNIAMGDPNFNITGTGPGLPLNNVGTGSHIITGAATWTGVTVTELTGNLQSVNLGDISCPPVISITTCDFATLQAAVGGVNAGGGTINFACSGTINFTNTLTIASNVIINENGNNVIFDGGNSVRHFGINAGATLTLNDFTLQNGNDGGLGGGSIINSGTLIANNNTFTNNIGGYGGALYNTGSVTLTGNVFSNNTASGNGGALFSSGTLTSTNDDYLNNTASWGGGLSNFGGSANMTLTNADIMNNHATQYGGGMINEGPLSIINSNFSNNTAATVGAGLANYFLSSSQGTTYTNNACDLGAVITNNGGNMSTASPNCPGPLALTASAVCNGDNLDVTITSGDSNYNITAVSGPGLPLNNVSNGVHTLTGPAAWDDVTVTELSFDNEGVNLGDFICSVGPMTYTVSTCDFASLQTAVANANASPAGGIINFTCSGTITLTSELAITNNVTINENGQTVVLDGGNSNRIFNINLGANLTLNDLTLQNGSAGGGDGGLIYNNGILIANNSTFTGGSAVRGGAIHTSAAGTSTVNTSTFSGNLGNYGGAIHNYGTTNINGSTFSGNGNGGTVAGGAIYNEFGILNIGAGSTFTGNQAEYGGAIYDFIGTTTITNASFTNNVATTDTTTGAIQNEGTVNSQNVTYTNNTCGGANVIT
ncbi:MAG: hypothetical protein KJ043_07240, partial [Anaerolineae bacterium]|nr:hypothetical protein [Anaerolineae bacterium]